MLKFLIPVLLFVGPAMAEVVRVSEPVTLLESLEDGSRQFEVQSGERLVLGSSERGEHVQAGLLDAEDGRVQLVGYIHRHRPRHRKVERPRYGHHSGYDRLRRRGRWGKYDRGANEYGCGGTPCNWGISSVRKPRFTEEVSDLNLGD